jgi:ABC-type multidrug transport system permease subunit
VSGDASPPRGDRPEQSSREIPWKLVAWIALAIYAAAFLLLNDERQDVSFVIFTVRTRLIWLILLSMALGAALAVVVPRWWRSRKDRSG